MSLTERTQHLEFLSRLGDETRPLSEPEDIMAAVANSLGRYMHVSRCAYADVESDSDHFTIHRDYTDNCPSTAGKYQLTLFGERAVKFLRAGKTYVVGNVDVELAGTDGADAFRAIGIQAIICCALVKQGNLVAMMAVHQITSRQWQAHEIALLEEVTERCWDTIERVKAQQVALRNEQQFRDYFEFAPDAQVLIASDGRVRLANRRFCALFDVAVEHITGRPATEVLPAAIIEHCIAKDAVKNGMLNEPEGHDIATPIVIETKQGRASGSEKRKADGRTGDRTLSVEVSQNQIQTAEGTLRALSLRDVSDRVALEEELRQSKKMETIGLLAGGIAHDFNNLLTVIIASAELTLLDSRLNTEFVKGIETIRDAGLQASQLTQQLLAFSRQQVLRPEIINLNAKLHDYEEMVRRLIGESIDVRLALESDLANVSLDATQLQQVVLNLAANARDAMPDGGTLTIATRNAASLPAEFGKADTHNLHCSAYVLLSISDTGEGISSADLDSIFEPFYTTKELGKGTGLGLSTVYGIVKQSNGYLIVESEPNKGSTFSMAFPASFALPQTVAQHDARLLRVRNGRILLVENSPELLESTRELLGSQGYAVDSVNDGEKALQLLQNNQHEVDLLITDVALPGMPGTTLARKARRYRPNLPILYTGGEGVDAVKSTLDSAAIDAESDNREQRFLARPFEVEQLHNAVDELLTAAQKIH